MPESTLKPFWVYTDEAEDGAELVWAADAAAAVTVAKSGPLFSDLDEETELYAGIEDVIPGTLPAAGTSPHVEARDRVLRQYGWSYEGDRRCDDCDLATMDGAFPLCVDCDRCTECGHADDCRRGLLLGNQAERFGEIAGRLIYVAGPVAEADDLPGWPPTPPPRVVPDRTPAEIIGENITQAYDSPR